MELVRVEFTQIRRSLFGAGGTSTMELRQGIHPSLTPHHHGPVPDITDVPSDILGEVNSITIFSPTRSQPAF